MNSYEKEYTRVLKRCVNGDERDTRTGRTFGVFGDTISIDLSEGFPVTTGKKIAWKSVVGELLWFLSGSTDLKDLRKFTFGSGSENRWTIWDDDVSRWGKGKDGNDAGELYAKKWRSYGGEVDQIKNLIENLKSNPYERNHIVMAWDALAIFQDKMALKPCHVGFQCYVSNDNKLHLQWYQRSADMFLGVPFNFASYALLTHLLAKWCGYNVGTLSVVFGDVHVYELHREAVNEYINNQKFELPKLKLPASCDDLESVIKMTANDFADSLVGYESAGTIKAPLVVGS